MNAERRFFPRSWKPKLLGLLVPVALSVAVQGSLYAGINDWTNTGPQGGAILVLTVDPQNPGTFYAGTATGVFKSIDGGITWANAGMSGWVVTHLLVDPQHSSTLYALTTGHPNGENPIIQAFQSTDGGTTWNQIGSLPRDCCAVVWFQVVPPSVLWNTWMIASSSSGCPAVSA